MFVVVLAIIVMRMAACSGGLVERSGSLQQAVKSNGAPQRLEFIAPAMGMQARIVMYAADADQAKVAAKAAFDEIARLDAILSDWRDDSELAKVNLEAGGLPVQVDASFIEVLQRAQEISLASDGACDVTVGPVTQLWRTALAQNREPQQSEIDVAHALVNWRAIEIDAEYRTVRLPKPGMRLDFGGIGKGYAADRALTILRERGFPACLAALEGDIALGDAPPGECGWLVSIADGLSDSASDSTASIQLHNCGVSTSGDAEQFLEIAGERYSHIFDPRTGVGLRERIAVAVIARDATASDALATAVSVMGPNRGLAMIDGIDGASARIVMLDHDFTRVVQSAAFRLADGG